MTENPPFAILVGQDGKVAYTTVRPIIEQQREEIDALRGECDRLREYADALRFAPKPIQILEGNYRLDKTPAGYHFTEMPVPDATIRRLVREERIMLASLPPLPSDYRWQTETTTDYDFENHKAVVTTQYKAVQR